MEADQISLPVQPSVPAPPPPPPIPEPVPLDAASLGVGNLSLRESKPIDGDDAQVEVPDDEEDIFKAVRYDHQEEIGRLLRAGVDVNQVHRGQPCIVRCRVLVSHIRMTKYTPLHVAVLHNALKTVAFLVDHGANVNSRDENNRTPLHYVANAGRADVLQYLLQKGCDINTQSASMKTPLMYAVLKANPVAVSLLIKSHADLDLQDEKGTSALHLASFSMPVKLFIVQLLLKGGANVHIANKKGATPLMMSVATREVALVEMLLDAGAVVDCVDSMKRTPFHSAIEISHSSAIVRLLVQRGADINAVDKIGGTPLSRSIRYGKMDTIRLLLSLDCYRDTDLLFGAAMKSLRESYSLFNQWMEQELNCPMSLLRLCRYTIRNLVQPGHMTELDNLIIPRTLKNYLQFK